MVYVLVGLWSSLRGLTISTVFQYNCCPKYMNDAVSLVTQNAGKKGSKIFLPSVCDLLRKMVLARGWSEGLYSMGRSEKRRTSINSQPGSKANLNWFNNQQAITKFCPLDQEFSNTMMKVIVHQNKIFMTAWCYRSTMALKITVYIMSRLWSWTFSSHAYSINSILNDIMFKKKSKNRLAWSQIWPLPRIKHMEMQPHDHYGNVQASETGSYLQLAMWWATSTCTIWIVFKSLFWGDN